MAKLLSSAGRTRPGTGRPAHLLSPDARVGRRRPAGLRTGHRDRGTASRPDATLGQAARLMARSRVRRLPVVGPGGALEGIVSRSDLLKVFLRDDDDIAAEVRREVVVRLFGTGMAPVGVDVHDGVVRLTGRVDDPAFVPLAMLLARSVPGVVDVHCALAGRRRRPHPGPDPPDPPHTFCA
ncbi:CBS domain-containing protein [Streptomyces sp. NPDC006739]|uniref:CBS domain-containing protein n=1 Tax=Streptomyces sp. NPDC006739 TaxID=3364763 RepID=UPI00367515A5